MQNREQLLAMADRFSGWAALGIFLAVSGLIWHHRSKLQASPAWMHVAGMVAIGIGALLWTASTGPMTSTVISTCILGLGVALVAASLTMPAPPPAQIKPPGELEIMIKQHMDEIRDTIARLEKRPMAERHRKMKIDDANKQLAEAMWFWLDQVRRREKL